LEFCASIQVQCRLTILGSETRPKAKPENIMSNHVPSPPYNKRFVLTGLHFLLNFGLGRPAAQTPDRYKAEDTSKKTLIGNQLSHPITLSSLILICLE
jgi:hypothetical protein